MVRYVFLASLLIGCGRIGFDQLLDGDSQGDAGSPGVGGSAGAGGGASGGAAGAAGTFSGVAGRDAGNGGVGGTSAGGTTSDAGLSGSGGLPGDAGGGVDAAPPTIPNHCQEIPPLAEPPNVDDGVLDPGMVLEPVTPVGWRETTVPLPSGHAMRYAVGWRPDGIYFFVEVTDPDRNVAPDTDFVWAGDGVELYVDHDASFDTPPPDYDAVGTRQFFVQAPAVDGGVGNRAEIRIPEVYTAWDPTRWHSEARTFGYVVEAFVEASALELPTLTLAAGQSVGIDLAHDVSYPPGQTGPEGARLSQYFLSVADPLAGDDYNDYPFYNEAVFCTPTLR